jgi:hypothetical protein
MVTGRRSLLLVLDMSRRAALTARAARGTGKIPQVRTCCARSSPDRAAGPSRGRAGAQVPPGPGMIVRPATRSHLDALPLRPGVAAAARGRPGRRNSRGRQARVRGEMATAKEPDGLIAPPSGGRPGGA